MNFSSVSVKVMLSWICQSSRCYAKLFDRTHSTWHEGALLRQVICWNTNWKYYVTFMNLWEQFLKNVNSQMLYKICVMLGDTFQHFCFESFQLHLSAAKNFSKQKLQVKHFQLLIFMKSNTLTTPSSNNSSNDRPRGSARTRWRKPYGSGSRPLPWVTDS